MLWALNCSNGVEHDVYTTINAQGYRALVACTWQRPAALFYRFNSSQAGLLLHQPLKSSTMAESRAGPGLQPRRSRRPFSFLTELVDTREPTGKVLPRQARFGKSSYGRQPPAAGALGSLNTHMASIQFDGEEREAVVRCAKGSGSDDGRVKAAMAACFRSPAKWECKGQ
ncbi:hypothetical protein CDD83_8305 [Cordyceps sp. RAO-2017]|nr:hypothetical protein CDD83_8305 [Cordyceps sp. RAO-2017]